MQQKGDLGSRHRHEALARGGGGSGLEDDIEIQAAVDGDQVELCQ